MAGEQLRATALLARRDDRAASPPAQSRTSSQAVHRSGLPGPVKHVLSFPAGQDNSRSNSCDPGLQGSAGLQQVSLNTNLLLPLTAQLRAQLTRHNFVLYSARTTPK